MSQVNKDISYYASKINTAAKNISNIDKTQETSHKDILYYNNKIQALCSGKEAPTKSLIYHINKISKIQEKEELTDESIKRYALFPILDEKGYEFYQKQEITHWSESELDFVADRKWYDQATPQVKKVFDTILAFFLVGDGVISKNIIFRFLLEAKTYEEQAMFISQLHIELIHAATYGLAAFTFKRTPESTAELIESAQNTECIKKKVNFMEKWMMSDVPRYQRLVAFACAEGIFFCTLFAVIFWFRSKGWFANFILANELIGNDESLHRDWGAYLFIKEASLILSQFEKDSKEYNDAYDEIKSTVYKIVIEACEIEYEFADYILDNNLEDLNAADLKTYAELITDNLLCKLSYSSYYNVSNPFTWLEDISMEQKGNFYEVRIGAYKRKSLSDVLNWRKRAGLVEEVNNAYDNPEDIDF